MKSITKLFVQNYSTETYYMKYCTVLNFNVITEYKTSVTIMFVDNRSNSSCLL
jgi:hypothetical protein